MKTIRFWLLASFRSTALVCASALAWLAPARADALTLTTLTPFDGTNSAQPVASLVLGADGNFYGTTVAGGANGYGTVFRASPAGILTTLASFDSTTTGARPFGPLLQDSEGNFYGTASAGGAYGNGTVFMLTASNTLSALASFAGTNGAQPVGGLVSGSNGVFYGTTYSGGAYGQGTVFSADTSGNVSTLVSFNGAANGAFPIGGLTVGPNGAFYGTASAGGAYNSGTVFRFTLGGSGGGTNTLGSGTNNSGGIVFTNLHFFTGSIDGAAPQGALVLGSDGSFYGTTAGGGTNHAIRGGCGTVFKLTAAGALTPLVSFGRTNGYGPAAPLVQGGDGNLYGTTRFGGASGAGATFSVTTSGVLTLLRSFPGGNGGSDPYYAGLTQGSDSNFYGTTSLRGADGAGTFYHISGFAPYIMGATASQTVPAGTTVLLGVLAGGSPPLTYHWQRNSNYLKDSTTFSGTTTEVLTVANATPANSGTYTVVVKNSAGAVTNDGIVLTVLNPYGTNQPTLHITSPGQGARLKNAVVTLSGTTSCSVPVSQVFYQLNDGGWQLATPQSGWGKWNAKLVLPPGPNVIQAYALNIVGTPSLTNTLNMTMGVTSTPVVVRISGAGTVSPNYDAQWLEVGQNWKILAQPRPGYLFSNWVETVDTNAPVFQASALLRFSAQSNLVLQANFVPSPFLPLSGAFNGLFYDTNDLAAQSAGCLSLKLTGNGAFSGRLQLGATRYPISGQFNLNGLAQITLPRAQPEPLQLAMQLDLAGGTEQITGTVSNSTWSAELVALRALFDGRTSVAPQAGRYTVVLPGNPADATQPGGDSYGALMVDTAGRVHFTGFLADGTKVTQATEVAREGQWALYVPLYHGAGMLLGACMVSNSTGASVTGPVTWSKPALPQEQYYATGFTRVSSVVGSRYTPPLETANPLAFTSAEVVLSGADLTQSITNQVSLGANGHARLLNGPGVTLSFAPATGLFHGTAVLPNGSQAAPIGGVVLQDQGLARGYFLGQSQSGQLLLESSSTAP